MTLTCRRAIELHQLPPASDIFPLLLFEIRRATFRYSQTPLASYFYDHLPLFLESKGSSVTRSDREDGVGNARNPWS